MRASQQMGVLIGRFQPLHLGHCYLIEQALQHCDTLYLAIGSADRARNVKNPWTFKERQHLIGCQFPGAPLQFAGIPDFFYAETAWIDAIKAIVGHTDRVTLFGHNKDSSSYYLNEFPTWRSIELPDFKEINATAIRQEYFENENIDMNTLPPITVDFLKAFQFTPSFQRLAEEACFFRDYKKSWAQSPYPPIFVTTDAIVTCNDHLLLIQRKFCPGKNLYALPGGFLEEKEWIKVGLIRELREETNIALDQKTLLNALKKIQVFDYPERSLIGRVISHVGHFELPLPLLPAVHAADDALSVTWIPFSKIPQIKDQFHDDHYQIIAHMLNFTGL